MRGIPGLTIVDPCDAVDLEQAVLQIAAHPGPVYLRLLRGQVPVVLDEYDEMVASVFTEVIRPALADRGRLGGSGGGMRASG